MYFLTDTVNENGIIHSSTEFQKWKKTWESPTILLYRCESWYAGNLHNWGDNELSSRGNTRTRALGPQPMVLPSSLSWGPFSCFLEHNVIKTTSQLRDCEGDWGLTLWLITLPNLEMIRLLFSTPMEEHRLELALCWTQLQTLIKYIEPLFSDTVTESTGLWFPREEKLMK